MADTSTLTENFTSCSTEKEIITYSFKYRDPGWLPLSIRDGIIKPLTSFSIVFKTCTDDNCEIIEQNVYEGNSTSSDLHDSFPTNWKNRTCFIDPKFGVIVL